MAYDNRINFLLKKYLSAHLSPEEQREFSQLLGDLEIQHLYDLYEEIDTLNPFFEELEPEYDHDRILQSIREEITPKAKKIYPFYWSAVAAVAIIILFFISKNLLFVSTKTNGISVAKQIESSISALDSAAVMLRLADGQVINWKQHNHSTYYKNGYEIDLMQDGGVRYAVDHNIWAAEHKNIGENVFSTKKGATSNIILEDGTRVWLNSSTALTFPTSFNGQADRTVEVVGEAYFEVAHNPKKPFVVISNYSRTTVLGTKFNIKAYPDQQKNQTTLLQGSVRINSANASSLLVPGVQATVKESGKISLAQVNVEDFIAWRNGLIYFDNLSVEEIIQELSHWYDITGIDNSSSNREHYTGAINKGKNIREVLNQLERISNTHLIIKERRVMIRD